MGHSRICGNGAVFLEPREKGNTVFSFSVSVIDGISKVLRPWTVETHPGYNGASMGDARAYVIVIELQGITGTFLRSCE